MRYKDRYSLLNWNLAQFAGKGKYEIPEIEGISKEEYKQGTEFIPFSEVLNKHGTAANGVHFYLDDYRFERVWNQPNRYIVPLNRYRYVMSPDFSIYTDMPKALQIFSHYRKHWCAALWEMIGIKVIPTICWSDEDSYDWCFEGEPKNSVVSVSSVGVTRDKEAVRLFNEGYAAMVERLHPSLVLFFGKDILSLENRYAAPLEMHRTFSQKLNDEKREKKRAETIREAI